MRYWVIIGEGTEFEALANLKSGVKSSEQSKGGIERSVIRGEDISFTVGGDGQPRIFAAGEEVEAPDVFMLWGHYSELFESISDRLESLGARSVNSIAAKRIVCSKVLTAQLLEKENIPQAKTMVITSLSKAENIIEALGLPVVVKPSGGAQGTGVELMHTKQELEAYIAALPEKSPDVIIAQEYIAASRGRDLRVTMTDFEPLASIVRHAGNKDEFRSNVHQGGYYELVEIDDSTAELCRKVARVCGLRICGIDLLYTETGFVVGEVNCTPGFPDEVLKTPEFAAAMKKLITSE